jgi:hypothetical protein
MSKSNKSAGLKRRQGRAIVAMLEHATVTDAAAACGIGYSTINRWLADDEEFRAELREAETRASEAAFGRLAARASQAVETLERNLSSGSHGVEVRAASAWLALIVKRAQAAKYDRMEKDLAKVMETLEAQEEQSSRVSI